MSPYSSVHLPHHPLAMKNGKVGVSRLVLWGKLNGQGAPCHWCHIPLTWKVDLFADHINGDTLDNLPTNIVPACRACNANREVGTGRGRRAPKVCEHCGTTYPVKNRNHHIQRYCSQQCAVTAIGLRRRGSTMPHGTIARYDYGCRCDDCRTARRDKSYLQRHGTLEGKRRGPYRQRSTP